MSQTCPVKPALSEMPAAFARDIPHSHRPILKHFSARRGPAGRCVAPCHYFLILYILYILSEFLRVDTS